MNKEPWLKWAWHYYALDVDTFATLDEALESAWYAGEAGDEALDHIEGPGGIVASDIIEADQDRRINAEGAALKAWPNVTHRVHLKTLDGKHSAVIGSHISEADAVAQATQWRETYGDRVSVESIRRGD